ncbi:flavoprotein [Halteromyces radiatus]|uniref:flavoprotein n=1 Tax=Halteromyces radiatus TaxID=101107 RepID=UPI00221E663C|nr:flavoprotein [Halteromyces radiatus]KAI8099094.1 flavoprotein [Halteromyces radiatus]
MSQDRQWNVLLGATGSVASIKLPMIVDELNKKPGINVKVVPTAASYFFFKDAKVNATIHTDEEEWSMWKKKTDPVLHIELRKWADIMVIAPLDANTLAKIANGICDNLLTSILRAWDTNRPVLVCPAMNTNMWVHPFTSKHLSVLEDTFDFKIVAPISKTLACGDTGVGAMAEPETIAARVFELLVEEDRVRNEDIISPDERELA